MEIKDIYNKLAQIDLTNIDESLRIKQEFQSKMSRLNAERISFALSVSKDLIGKYFRIGIKTNADNADGGGVYLIYVKDARVNSQGDIEVCGDTLYTKYGVYEMEVKTYIKNDFSNNYINITNGVYDIREISATEFKTDAKRAIDELSEILKINE